MLNELVAQEQLMAISSKVTVPPDDWIVGFALLVRATHGLDTKTQAVEQ
jgi:hypothetical protein